MTIDAELMPHRDTGLIWVNTAEYAGFGGSVF